MKIESTESLGLDIPEMSNIQVIEYLVATHHEFTRDIMAEISDLLDKAMREIPNPSPELLKLSAIWLDYRREMAAHLEDEEKILFPWIEKLHEAENRGEPPLDTYSDAIRQMITEHKHHEGEMEVIRDLGDRLLRISGKNPVLMSLGYKLKQLDADLREHMRLEADYLFPRILASTERQGCFGPIPSRDTAQL